jgi:hypothetical protein
VIDIALHYARRGWPVFPLHGKVPAIPRERGGRGCHDATLNLNLIDRWWREYPGANVGIATGRCSRLLVIDIDPRQSDKWLESVHALALPPTFTVKTWSGGWHLYFKFSGDALISIGTNLLRGIDWRGNGGYVVGAGSVVNGATYEISKPLPIADAPEPLLQRIIEARAHRRIERDPSGHMVIAESRRNDTLMRIGCALRRWGVGYNALLESLQSINQDHCHPTLDDAELRKVAASVSHYPPKESA